MMKVRSLKSTKNLLVTSTATKMLWFQLLLYPYFLNYIKSRNMGTKATASLFHQKHFLRCFDDFPSISITSKIFSSIHAKCNEINIFPDLAAFSSKGC